MRKSGIARRLRDNGLTLALLALFAGSIVGQMIAGFHAENEERLQQGAAAIGFAAYLSSGAFLSAIFENWESEFLQMWAYVTLTRISSSAARPSRAIPMVKKRGRARVRARALCRKRSAPIPSALPCCRCSWLPSRCTG